VVERRELDITNFTCHGGERPMKNARRFWDDLRLSRAVRGSQWGNGGVGGG